MGEKKRGKREGNTLITQFCIVFCKNQSRASIYIAINSQIDPMRILLVIANFFCVTQHFIYIQTNKSIIFALLAIKSERFIGCGFTVGDIKRFMLQIAKTL